MPEHELRASGRLRVLLVLNLSRFIAHEELEPIHARPGDPARERAVFNHLRGSGPFVQALRAWTPSHPFQRDRDQDRVEAEGYRLRVFRSRLRERQFLPTYRMHWTPELCEELRRRDPALVDEWTCWAPQLRFTPYGLAAVILERRMEDAPLVLWSERLIELQCDRHVPGEENLAERQIQWWLSQWVLTHFLASVGWQLQIDHDGQTQTIFFRKPTEESRPLRLDRYAMHIWERVAGPDGEVSPQELKQSYKNALVGALESTLLVEGGRKRYPLYALDTPALEDLTSWEEELCLLTGEGGLLYTPLQRSSIALIGGSHNAVRDSYGAYWDAIVRGIEHIVVFRAEAERTQRRTIELLSMVPQLTQHVSDGSISKQDEQHIGTLASGLSDIFDTLPEQRSMTISAIFFRSDSARQKFDVLMERLDIPEILEQIDTNVEQLSFFLEYYNDMRLQWQSQHVNALAGFVAVLVAFMAASSFLADLFQLSQAWNESIGFLTLRSWTWLTFGLLALAVLLWYLNYRRIRQGRR
jgi:hypothetical protein